MDRRRFGALLGASAAAAGGAWLLASAATRMLARSSHRTVAREDELAVGGSRLFEHPGPDDPCILIRTGKESSGAA